MRVKLLSFIDQSQGFTSFLCIIMYVDIYVLNAGYSYCVLHAVRVAKHTTNRLNLFFFFCIFLHMRFFNLQRYILEIPNASGNLYYIRKFIAFIFIIIWFLSTLSSYFSMIVNIIVILFWLQANIFDYLILRSNWRILFFLIDFRCFCMCDTICRNTNFNQAIAHAHILSTFGAYSALHFRRIISF